MHPDEPSTEDLTLSAVMAALRDPVRVAIPRSLACRQETTCGRLELGISKATRSHLLKVLREAGLTHTRAEGTHRYVSLRRADVDERFPGLLGAILAAADGGAGSSAPAAATAVLA